MTKPITREITIACFFSKLVYLVHSNTNKDDFQPKECVDGAGGRGAHSCLSGIEFTPGNSASCTTGANVDQYEGGGVKIYPRECHR